MCAACALGLPWGLIANEVRGVTAKVKVGDGGIPEANY